MTAAIAAATTAMPQPMSRPVRKPLSDVRDRPAAPIVGWERARPITAAPSEVPSERMSVWKLFAAAVSESGTELMMSAGMIPHADPISASGSP